jgi:hypothetical protein
LRLNNGVTSAVSKSQAFRFAATAVAYTAKNAVGDGCLGLMPQCPTNTTSGSDVQCAVGWTITPRAAPIFGLCGVYSSELARGGTFSTTLVGTTARTYITLYDTAGPFGPIGATASAGYMDTAMLWE